MCTNGNIRSERVKKGSMRPSRNQSTRHQTQIFSSFRCSTEKLAHTDFWALPSNMRKIVPHMSTRINIPKDRPLVTEKNEVFKILYITYLLRFLTLARVKWWIFDDPLLGKKFLIDTKNGLQCQQPRRKRSRALFKVLHSRKFGSKRN